MQSKPERLSRIERDLVANTIGCIAKEKNLQILAATIQATHIHLVMSPLKSGDVQRMITLIKYRTAAAVLKERRHHHQPTPRSLWTRGQFPVFIFEEKHLANAIEYVRDHNRQEGLPPDPFDWIHPLYLAKRISGERFWNDASEEKLIV